MTADAVGGVWQYAIDLARGLAQHEVETTLAVLGPSPTPEQMADAAAVADLRLLDMGLPLDWTASTADEVHGAARALARLALERGADIVHLNSGALGAQASFAAPVVVACHSCVATWWQTVKSGPLPDDFRWRTKLTFEGYRAADALIAPTAAFAELTRRTYGLSEAPAVVHNGRRLAPTRLADAPLTSPFAFTAGRLWDEGKNVAALDRAAARLGLAVVAAGPLQGPNGVAAAFRNVKTLGKLSDGEIASWLRSASVFVSTARYEPFGLAVLEAAQAGCPLVLADIPTFRELWNGAALFVDPDDERAIAAAVEQVVESDMLGDELRAAASERALDYTVEGVAAGTFGVYGSLLALGRKAPRGREVAA